MVSRSKSLTLSRCSPAKLRTCCWAKAMCSLSASSVTASASAISSRDTRNEEGFQRSKRCEYRRTAASPSCSTSRRIRLTVLRISSVTAWGLGLGVLRRSTMMLFLERARSVRLGVYSNSSVLASRPRAILPTVSMHRSLAGGMTIPASESRKCRSTGSERSRPRPPVSRMAPFGDLLGGLRGQVLRLVQDEGQLHPIDIAAQDSQLLHGPPGRFPAAWPSRRSGAVSGGPRPGCRSCPGIGSS